MFCIYCGYPSKDENLQICPSCGKNLYKEVTVNKQQVPPTFKVISGSPQMIEKIPKVAPMHTAVTIDGQ